MGFFTGPEWQAESLRLAWESRGVTTRAQAITWLKSRRDAFAAAGTLAAVKAPVGDLFKLFADILLRSTVFPGEAQQRYPRDVEGDPTE